MTLMSVVPEVLVSGQSDQIPKIQAKNTTKRVGSVGWPMYSTRVRCTVPGQYLGGRIGVVYGW